MLLQGLTTFVEGLITFLSPCVLPMLPVYVLYFTGGEDAGTGRTLARALSFSAGFGAVFVLLGVFAGTLGALLARYQRIVNVALGLAMIVLGLAYAGVLRLPALERLMGALRPGVRVEAKGCLSCAALGVIFSVGWSPCTGTFLGSAMMMAAAQGHALGGVALLACYALGLAVPFVLCALAIDRLKGALNAVKRHYAAVNRACGAFLVLVGLLMMTGWFARLPRVFM